MAGKRKASSKGKKQRRKPAKKARVKKQKLTAKDRKINRLVLRIEKEQRSQVQPEQKESPKQKREDTNQVSYLEEEPRRRIVPDFDPDIKER
jgi:hypothetical protein